MNEELRAVFDEAMRAGDYELALIALEEIVRRLGMFNGTPE